MSESTDPSMAVSTAEEFKSSLRSLLHTSRNIDVETLSSLSANESQNGVPDILSNLVSSLPASEAEAIKAVIEKVTDSPAFGGLDITNATNMTPEQYEEVLFLLSAHLEALNHARYAYNSIIPQAKPGVEPMTLAEKIFALHSLTPLNGQSLHSGSVVRVGLDWILASELSWSSMARTHASLGAPEIWRNDRFWLAGDHVVHPEVRSVPKVARMIDVAEKAKKAFRMTEYQGMNYTIMHTEFVRERAEPGMLCVGSDSHSCSAGAMGCLSIGLGAADVTMALVMGQTWFKIPEIINIELVGTPGKAIAGKDVILHILGELKRNTVASERIVEFTGEACQHLSIDARFAICNMCTEFGAVTGVFAPDEVTRKYVEGRRRKANRINSVYLKPDEGAKYAGKWTIDLSKVEHTVAVYPKPDHVVPVSEKAGMKLDGVFIGACTTTEEEIVLAALVLKAGLKKGIPLASGKRHYVPGSLPIVDKLGKLGLLEVYEQAGFTRGPPGCSYCVGISAEKAEKGEVWLSSQNRNFENRMGPGSFGNLSSAVVCAASSFSLTITDPAPFVAEMDIDWFENTYLKKSNSLAPTPSKSLTYVEPNLSAPLPKAAKAASLPQSVSKPEPMSTLKSTIITLGDYIDTDALAPGYALTTCVTDEEFGEHCLEQTHPDFRSTIKSYPNSTAVVVAGSAFGVGSSRENAVSALKGCGVKCVISKSFAFILGRNCPSLGLLAFNMDDETFYEAAKDGRAIEVDVSTHTVRVEVDGQWKEWKFTLSEMEYQLTINKGLTESFRRYGKAIFEGLLGSDKEEAKQENGMAALELVQSEHRPDKETDW